MGNNISLNASMRSNLLSLQQTAKLQDITQNRLSTGLKVSTAIDNPSSYYTAQALSARAEDLSALLDSMGQGVQTIKAATETLEAGTKFLEQTKAVANQVLEKSLPISATVTNEAELLDAINNSGAGYIVVDGAITLSPGQELQLKDGQRLVGARYFDQSKAAGSITFDLNSRDQYGIVMANDSILSDLSITVTTSERPNSGAIFVNNVKGVTLNNIDISYDTQTSTNTGWPSAIHFQYSEGTLSGNININTKGDNTRGLAVYYGSNVKTVADTQILINTSGFSAQGVVIAYKSPTFTLNAGSSLMTNVSGTGAYGISQHSGILNIRSDSKILTKNIVHGTADASTYIEANAKIAIGSATSPDFYTTQAFAAEKKTISFTQANFATLTGAAADPVGWTLPDFTDYNRNPKFPTKVQYLNSEDYNSLLGQYDQLIKDGGYKGINLLLEQGLKINFNEDRSSSVEIEGQDASTKGLGLREAKWQTAKDIEASIAELESAISQIRSMSSEFGNYYSIVTNREEFTENLINVLTEGADKLTLADMNEESANTLALQTRQQLAVNSLSLASQASQSVLKLF